MAKLSTARLVREGDIFLREMFYKRTAPRLNFDQTFAFQHLKCIDNRCPAYPQTVSDVFNRNFLSWTDLSLEDPLLEKTVGLFCQV